MTYAIVDPTSGAQGDTYATATGADIENALALASAAHRLWWKSGSVGGRAALLRRIAELHRERAESLAAIITREMGKPIIEALDEVDFSARIYEYYADNAADMLQDEPIEPREAGRDAFVRYESLGVILGIMPWNFPIYQVARFAAPNLALGNVILLKHAPQCPSSATAIEEIFRDAGAPDGAYVNVFLSNAQVVDVIADERVQGVSLTGSERAGAAVAAVAGQHLKKVVLELGGSDPFIVLSTDDLDAVVDDAVGARLYNNGQACNAAKRFIIVDDLYEAFLERFTAAMQRATPGDPARAETELGPLASTAARERLEAQVDRALIEGARRLTGGRTEGNWFDPTVLVDVGADSAAFSEEFFGPVATVARAADEEDAIRLANNSPYGLGSYVFTVDADQAIRVANQLEAGMVFVNTIGEAAPELPFGGRKRSGFGRELGRHGAYEFANRKLIYIALTA
ncbi:NAD-dependent succinate-semialdehyde dehydrogenase [Microbacterium sp. ARD31]|uniref:NAD-dependent succinate-semialdehyde dehydrogenase n=1 Tax=Microbacterium sp. ARD31 TaxID=2962576 RepID=UPI0028822442|nr:NAD-dependent succinate-semialdehyde dehydrogenase [Microbacterium sp. ARD31]MDT0186054.1 NAD-dependent succinate-semialdehyde dehydrogenase [Microbacterium sp. ARD31]